MYSIHVQVVGGDVMRAINYVVERFGISPISAFLGDGVASCVILVPTEIARMHEGLESIERVTRLDMESCGVVVFDIKVKPV